MLARLAMLTVLLTAGGSSAVSSVRVYAVSWSRTSSASPEVVQQVDVQLREELKRRGASVVDRVGPSTILLKPEIEVLPTAMRINVLGVRAVDQKLLGTISAKASGASRTAQMKALVKRVCAESEQLAP
ncbi:MAG: hypothetical protein ACO1OB_24060 [Archangium sp.]